MFKIDTPHSVAVEPNYADNQYGATPGFFFDGSPQSGIDATEVSDEWLNCLQSSLVNVITHAGLSPGKDATLLRQAIVAIANASGAIVGEVRHGFWTTPPTGWLALNGQTIGSANSTATKKHNSLQALFALLWADAACAVSGGRGASAAADWAANKSLTLPDARSRVVAGAGQGAGLTNLVLGAVGGAETITLSEANLPSHTHTTFNHQHSIADHTHSIPDHRHTLPDHQHWVPAHNHLVPRHQHHIGSHVHGMEHEHLAYRPLYLGAHGDMASGNNWASIGGNASTWQVSRQFTDGPNWDMYSDWQEAFWTSDTSGNGFWADGTGVLGVSWQTGFATYGSGNLATNLNGAGNTGPTGSGTGINIREPYLAVTAVIFAAPGILF